MKKIVFSYCLALTIIFGLNSNSSTAMDNKSQILETVLEECVSPSDDLPNHIRNKIDSLKLSLEELKNFLEQIKTTKPECISLIRYLDFCVILEGATIRPNNPRPIAQREANTNDSDEDSELDPATLGEIQAVRRLLFNSPQTANQRRAYMHLRGLIEEQASGFLS